MVWFEEGPEALAEAYDIAVVAREGKGAQGIVVVLNLYYIDCPYTLGLRTERVEQGYDVLLVWNGTVEPLEVGVVAHDVEEHACVWYLVVDVGSVYAVLGEEFFVEESLRERVSERVSYKSIFIHVGLSGGVCV